MRISRGWPSDEKKRTRHRTRRLSPPVHTSAAHVTWTCLSHTSKIGSHQEKTADNAESRAYTSELDIAQNTKEHEAAVTDSCICTRCRDALGGIHRGTRLYENQESGRTKRKNDERRAVGGAGFLSMDMLLITVEKAWCLSSRICSISANRSKFLSRGICN